MEIHNDQIQLHWIHYWLIGWHLRYEGSIIWSLNHPENLNDNFVIKMQIIFHNRFASCHFIHKKNFLTVSYGQFEFSAKRSALMWPSFLVTIPQGFVAAADWSIAWEKYSLESGDNNWKATLAEPADSKNWNWDQPLS